MMLLLICCVGIHAADSAQQTLDKCVSRLKGATGISADFTLSRQGRSMSGKIKEKGNRFCIITSTVGTWYDGKTMTTWSADTNEASVFVPTSDELSETNPLLLLQTSSSYSVSFGTGKGADRKVLVLTPKRRGMSAKKITVTLAAASLLPQRIDVTLADGKTMSVTLRNVSLKAQVSDADFRFNKSKYPKVKINNLM